MFQTLKKNWKLFLSSPPGRRFQDLHERRKSEKGKGLGGKALMIAGVVIAVLGLVLLPLPGPGSIVLAVGLMMVAAESAMMAKGLDWADKKRAELMSKVLLAFQRWGPVKCFLLGVGVGALLLAGGLAVWHWLT